MTCFRATRGHNARNICSQFAFQSVNSPAPGHTGGVLFIVEQYAPLPSDFIWNPFTSHAAFGVGLWSDKMEDILEVVPLGRLKCHTISSRWANDTLVIKALDRTS